MCFFFHFYSNFIIPSVSKQWRPDQTPRSEVSDLGMHCLPMSNKNIWVNLSLNLYPANIFALKMSSAYYVCCIYSNALQNTFTMEENTMNPDQTLILVHSVCNAIYHGTTSNKKAYDSLEWRVVPELYKPKIWSFSFSSI